MSIEIGIKGRAEDMVREENTAQAVGSGTLPVFATPDMIALMEKAAWTSLAPYWSEGRAPWAPGWTITHDSATPLGMKVWAESEVTAVDGKRITLAVGRLRRGGPHRPGRPRALHHHRGPLPGQGRPEAGGLSPMSIETGPRLLPEPWAGRRTSWSSPSPAPPWSWPPRRWAVDPRPHRQDPLLPGGRRLRPHRRRRGRQDRQPQVQGPCSTPRPRCSPRSRCQELTGHAVGGVCPFANPEGVTDLPGRVPPAL